MMRTARSRSSFSGVGRRTTSPVSVAIPPSLVRAPVATTTACAEPAATNVPANTMSCASATSEGASPGVAASRATGIDSPVSIWWSTRSPADSRIRPSAEIRSPSRRTSTSPGTRSAAGTNVRRPSRRAATVSGISSASAAVAFAARSSWLKLNTPFTITTTTIAAPSSGIPPIAASTAAAHSINAKKWVSWATSRRRGPLASRCGMRFWPTTPRIATASSVVRPSGRERTASSTAAGSSIDAARGSSVPSGVPRTIRASVPIGPPYPRAGIRGGARSPLHGWAVRRAYSTHR